MRRGAEGAEERQTHFTVGEAGSRVRQPAGALAPQRQLAGAVATHEKPAACESEERERCRRSDRSPARRLCVAKHRIARRQHLRVHLRREEKRSFVRPTRGACRTTYGTTERRVRASPARFGGLIQAGDMSGAASGVAVDEECVKARVRERRACSCAPAHACAQAYLEVKRKRAHKFILFAIGECELALGTMRHFMLPLLQPPRSRARSFSHLRAADDAGKKIGILHKSSPTVRELLCALEGAGRVLPLRLPATPRTAAAHKNAQAPCETCATTADAADAGYL